MAHKIGDRLKEQASTAGLNDFALTGALAGFDPFSEMPGGWAAGDTTWYCAVNGTEWEIGEGIRGATSSDLTRPAVPLQSSNADAKVNFSAPPVVFCTVPASKLSIQNAPVFDVKRTTAQSIPNNNNTKVLFTTKDTDTANAFDTATSRFQPKVAGWYSVYGSVAAGANPSGNIVTELWKNGASVAKGTQITGGAVPQHCWTVSTLVYLNGSTDYVELYFYQSSGGAVDIGSAGNNTYLRGAMLLSQQVGLTSDSLRGPLFSAVQTQAQLVPATTPTKLAFHAEEFDSHNAFANGRFQPTIPGYYDLNGAVSFISPIALNSFVSFYKNGVEAKRGVQLNASVYTLTASAKIYLNGTSDYVELWLYAGQGISTGGSPQGSYFQGARI